MSIIDLLQAETERLGFLLSGVSLIAPPPHRDTFARWIEAGHHAGMAYLAAGRSRERRADPSLVKPGSKAMIVAGMRYANPESIPDGPSGEALGRVAAYAWGADYHDVIPPRLAELGRALEEYSGKAVQTRVYTDTAPILEHDFAQQAGLGWIGKNTCLILPQSGSYYLLGEMFVDAELDPSAPFHTDHCGTCRRCIEACPTEAIRPDRTIDAGRCISYLTIENKGPIPAGLRPKLGNWVFGCDICQMVCPWNIRFAGPEGHQALAPRAGVPRPVLRHELRLTPEAFNKKFKGSPVQRARRRGYLRNVAVALGNARDTSAVPDLAETLECEPEPLVRAHAAWALGQLRTALSRSALENSARREEDPAVLAEIRSAMA